MPDLYDYLPLVLFSAKDSQRRYSGANKLTLSDAFGMDNASELIGRTHEEFLPSALAKAYHAEDSRVM